MKKLALLGNFSGKVKAWYLPSDWVFVRLEKRNKLHLTLARNPSNVPNVYGMMVHIENGAVIFYDPDYGKVYNPDEDVDNVDNN